MENGVFNWSGSRLLTETPHDYGYQRKEEKEWVFIKERTMNIVKGEFAFVVYGVDNGVKNEGKLKFNGLFVSCAHLNNKGEFIELGIHLEWKENLSGLVSITFEDIET